MMTPKEIGSMIKNWRAANNMSRATLAALIGSSEQAIKFWEDGDRNISKRQSARLAKMMSIHTDIFNEMIAN